MSALDALLPIERAAVIATTVLCGGDEEELAAAVRPATTAEVPTEFGSGWLHVGVTPDGHAVYTRPFPAPTWRPLL